MRDAEMQRAEFRRWVSMLAAFERQLQLAPKQMQSPEEAQVMAVRARRTLRWLARAWRLAVASHAAAPARTPGPSPVRRRRHAAFMAAWQGRPCPVPPFVEAEEQFRNAALGTVVDAAPRSRIAELRALRRAVVDIGLWNLFDRAVVAGLDFNHLQAENARHLWPVAPGLRPDEQRAKRQAPAFAHSADAAVLFNVRLRGLLRNLCACYSQAGFESWVRDDYLPGVSEVEPYARSWSVATVATYLDWWRARSDSDVAAARRLTGGSAQVRFKLPPELGRTPAGAAPGALPPAALPTDAPVHAVIVVGLVLAQVLNYQAGRWREASPRRGLPVPFVLDRLGQSDTQLGGEDGRRNVTRYAALTVEPLYGAVTIERLLSLAPGRSP